MRKNINKLVAFAIGISVISGGIIPAFAADNAQSTTNNNVIYVQGQMKPVLTLDDAINAVVDNSEKLALQSKLIKYYEDQLDMTDEMKDLQNNGDFQYDKLDTLTKQSKEQKEYMKDQIAQDITNKYNDLVTKENDLKKIKKQIEINTKLLSDDQLREKLGMKTSLDVKTTEINLQKLKNSEALKENQLKNSQDYFKVLTGKDVNQYSLEQDQKYEAFRISGSVDEYFDEVIDKYKKYDKKLNELTKDHLKDIETDKPSSSDKPDKDDYYTTDPVTGAKVFDSDKYKAKVTEYGNKWTDYASYLQQKFSYNSSVVTLNETEKALKDGLKQSYASLLDMENGINVKKANIEVSNKQLSIAKLKYDTGLMTKTDYENQVIANDDLETDLRNTINSYNTLKNQIQKPWISAAGASASAGASSASGAGA